MLTAERIKAWNSRQDLATHAVVLPPPCDGYAVFVSPDASDGFWKTYFTHVLQYEVEAWMAVEDMSLEPLGVLNGVLLRSKDRCPTVDQEVGQRQVSVS